MPKGDRFISDWTCPRCGLTHRFSVPAQEGYSIGMSAWMVCDQRLRSGRRGCDGMSLHTWRGDHWEYTGQILERSTVLAEQRAPRRP